MYKCTVQKQKKQMNGNRAIWLVCWTDTNACGFWLVKWTLGWKNFMPEELSRNQSILQFDIILQHNWPIKQCLLQIRIFFGRKMKRPYFDLFIHWLIKQIMNTFWNHFLRSYEIALCHTVYMGYIGMCHQEGYGWSSWDRTYTNQRVWV